MTPYDKKRIEDAAKRVDEAIVRNIVPARWLPVTKALVAFAEVVVEVAVTAARTGERR